jgi:hypothetical protein
VREERVMRAHLRKWEEIMRSLTMHLGFNEWEERMEAKIRNPMHV